MESGSTRTIFPPTTNRARRTCAARRNLPRHARNGLVAAVLAAALIGLPAFATAQSASAPPGLLSRPSSFAAIQSTGGGVDQTLTRERRVAVNLQHLDPRSARVPTPLSVELFDGQMLTLDPEGVEQRGPGNYTWKGKVRGYGSSQAILTVVDGQIAGTITYHDTGARKSATFRIQSGPGGEPSLQEIDPNAFPPDHPADPVRRLPPQSSSQPAGDVTGQSLTGDATTGAGDSAGTVDVMVVYSNQAAAAAGSAIGAQIQQAIDQANAVYANSGITSRLRLVHYEQIAYSDSGNFVTDLNRLTTTGDGYMDNVHTLRNTYGADLVSLFVENKQYCGYARIGPNANYAFSVVNRGCASGNMSFVHELGHNVGALHDPYVDSSTSPYAYGHGTTDASQRWRTVMAYNDACVAAGTSCTRIPYSSNPNLSYGDPPHALGTTSTNDNARVHNQNAYTVANFRVAGGGTCTYAFSPGSASIGSGAASGSFSVTSGSGCAWNSTSGAAWLIIGSGSGTSASGTLYYSAAANSGPARSASVTVGGLAFTVSQASGCTYALSPTSASVAAGGASGSFTLTAGAGCTWSVSSSASWLTVTSATSGSGNATITYSVAANTGSMRSANLSVGGRTFVVTQAAATTCTYALSPTSASVAAGGASGSLTLTAGAGCTWSVSSSASWLTVTSATSGSGNATITYSVAANTGSMRSANLSVGGRTFVVTQAAATTCTYALSPTSASVAAGGGSGSFTLTAGAGCAWSVTSGATWLTVTSATSGTGNATIAYSVASNTGSTRSASLSVGGKSFTVTQAAALTATVAPAPAATLSASALNFGNQKVGTTSAAKSVTVTNSGGGTLSIASLTAGGANPGDFARAGTCAVNMALAAGQSCTIQYTFGPSASGTRTASLTIGTNAGNKTISLTGKGRR